MNRKKGVLIGLSTAIIFAGGFAGYNALAGGFSKAEKLVNMKKEFEIADQELSQIKNPSESEAKGRQLKQKAREVAALENEVNPNPEKELEKAIEGLETALEISEMEHKQIQTAEHKKALEIIAQKRKMLEDVKANKQSKAKTFEQLMGDIKTIRSIIEMPAASNQAP